MQTGVLNDPSEIGGRFISIIFLCYEQFWYIWFPYAIAFPWNVHIPERLLFIKEQWPTLLYHSKIYGISVFLSPKLSAVFCVQWLYLIQMYCPKIHFCMYITAVGHWSLYIRTSEICAAYNRIRGFEPHGIAILKRTWGLFCSRGY